ncbi:DUF1254 domain-containing protein [Flavobacterium sp. IB48]|uniref:DUF1254 domain-containing protein n=1 Tax=Flavobacterium sp. IB48 TaxID=2779375 RepID=UPI0018E7C207|nr:DUF1254 domain-containing protein [Flavobacterium sp. IB48]MBJ2127294.1 DUF1254 domain-containing protein [Flavobacterium sp. IB48]
MRKLSFCLCVLIVSMTSCKKETVVNETSVTAQDSTNASIDSSKVNLKGSFAGTTFSKEYVRAIGQFAYVWGWPIVNSFNRRVALTSVSEPGLRGGVLPNAPVGHIAMLTDYIAPDQRFVACPNQDVTYGMGYGSLDDMPVVMQVPDFGDRFWVYAAWDARTDEFSKLGKQYGTKPGFYLMVGPNWKGKVPAGISGVFRSSTELAAFCPRVFLNDTDEDRKAIQPVLNQIMAYPLTEFDGKMKTIDWKKVPHFPVPGKSSDEEIQWVPAATFFDQLPDIMKKVPPLKGEESIYATINAVLDAAKKDPSLMAVLKEVALTADKEMIQPLKQWKYNGVPAGNGWFSDKNNADFGVDYFVRTATSKSNMYENVYTETKYIYTDFDSSGKELDGNNSYKVTFKAGQEPPVEGFWSLTLYNDHHFFHPNSLKRYSLGTKNKSLKRNADGSLTLYAGAKSPGTDKESNWLPAPKGHFSVYLRSYGPKQSVIDGTWMPPIVEKY